MQREDEDNPGQKENARKEYGISENRWYQKYWISG